MNALTDKQLASSRTGGTSRQGYINATYKQLMDILGEPVFNTPSGDNKTQVGWVVEFEGKYFTAYDWKAYDRDYTINELTEFNVGGISDASDFITLLEGKIR